MGIYVQIQYCSKNPVFVVSSFLNEDCTSRTKSWSNGRETTLTSNKQFQFQYWGETVNGKGRSKGKGKGIVCAGILFPVDSWALEVDSPLIASQLSAFSLLPYLGFLYFITKSKSAPRLTLFGFYFLLAFVGAAIPAGIYAKLCYITSLSNVDWLHGGAESLLMLTNLFIVLGLREALRKAEDKTGNTLNASSGVKEEKKSSI